MRPNLFLKHALAILRTRSGRAHEQRELARESAFEYPSIDRLLRYSNSAHKLFFKALAELNRLRAEEVAKKPQEDKEAEEEGDGGRGEARDHP